MYDIAWKELTYKTGKFYGVCNNCFKIGSVVFEALEDENDGYRSSLKGVNVLTDEEVKSRDLIFFHESIAQVKIITDEDNLYLADTTTGHTWLRVGTDTTDSCYPMFRFEYTPVDSKWHKDNILNTVSLHLED